MSNTEFEVEGLDELVKKVEKMAGTDFPKEFDNMVKRLAMDLMAQATENTPVDGGDLKMGWEVGELKHSGDTRVIEVFNNMDYSDYVEFGHRVPGGGFVEGRFMLTIPLEMLERRLPLYLQSWLDDFMKKHK